MRLVVAMLFICSALIDYKAVHAGDPVRDDLLTNYEGDWLFRGDRRQIWSALRHEGGSLLLREQFDAICGRVTRKWKIEGRRSDGKYTGSMRTIFKGERVCSVIGEWNASENSMTWSLEGDPDYAKIRHQFKDSKIVVTMLQHADDPSLDNWHELGTLYRLLR